MCVCVCVCLCMPKYYCSRCAISRGDPSLHPILVHCVPMSPQPKNCMLIIQPFLWGSQLCPTDTQTDCACLVPSVLCRCLLGGRKGIRPVKNWEWWAQQMPLPLTVSWFSKIQIGFTFLLPAHLCSPGKRAVKRVCFVCMFAEGSRRRQWQ